MKILYISVLTSTKLINQIHEESGLNPGFQAQKFHSLIARGFVRNRVEIQTLTALPISRSISKKIWWHVKGETHDGVRYKYIPFANIPGLKQLCFFLYSFFYTLIWGFFNSKNKAVVCDVLNISLCIGSLWACKLLNIKIVGIMTDMPGLMVSRDTIAPNGIFRKLISIVNKSYLSSFSSYVFLTDQMNKSVNRKKKPYIIMEGLVDEKMAEVVKRNHDIVGVTDNKRILLYAGGLHEKYGLKTLTEAFIRLPFSDIRLYLYGNGPFVEDLINNYCKIDKRIDYRGIVSNDDVVKAELSATILVNPRPTTEEFTLYSFPSKNMEYMVSGTPVLTTRLPGMPEEYYPYVYMFSDETIDGYTSTLEDLLAKPIDELQNKGQTAKEFVLRNKNNVYQAKRIIDLIMHN